MADQAILREYLVALGFKVDETEKKKFSNELVGMDKKAIGLSKAVLGVAVAAQAMVATFAFQMEKLYYLSKRTDSTVGNIKAIAYGFGQVGLSADQMKTSLNSFAGAIRSNPGLTGLLNSLGVQVTGRDKADVMMDFVAQIRKMPPYVAERYAALFGMDPETLFTLSAGLEKLKAAQAIRKQMSADAGVDTEKAAAASMEYANSLREVWEKVGLLKDALAIQLLPTFRSFTKGLSENLTELTRWLIKFDSLSSAVSSFFKSDAERKLDIELGKAPKPGTAAKPKNFIEWLTTPVVDYTPPVNIKGGPIDTATMARSLIPDWARRPENRNQAHTGAAYSGAGGGRGFVNPGALAGTNPAPLAQGSPAKLFEELEAKYALPAGLLDRVWKRESNRGDKRYMLSSAGAKGHFGFMDATAKQYGVKDPNDLTQSATGSAKYFADLLKQNEGDLRRASAAYNWGPGNLQRYGLGRAPKETRDYMDAVAGPASAPTIKQENHFHINGAQDPKAVSREVANNQRSVNADMVRQFTPRVN